MMRWPKKYVWVAANGHLMVSWPDAGHSFYTMLCSWLWLRHGLRRTGKTVYSPVDIIILPDLVGAGVRLESGWDNWSGYHFLSVDQAGDLFLRRTLARDA